MHIRIAFALLLFVFASCNSRQQHGHSFYYWKLDNSEYPHTDTAINANEIQQLGVSHFYIHFMDVDWSENLRIPVPAGELSTDNMDLFFRKGFTPVVFITNRTFERMPDGWCDTLAQKIKFRIARTLGYMNMYDVQRAMDTVWAAIKIPPETDYMKVDSIRNYKYDSTRQSLNNKLFNEAVKEIQIDCDWTAKTKEKYFRFLHSLKQQLPGKKVSVTVRLYPYKYPGKIGVPPVDKAVLMCYNMGHINEPQTTNSVFDINELKQYLDAKDYPLPLDIALPIFGWYAWFHGPQFKGIIYDAPELAAQPLLKKQDGNNYLVTADTVVQNRYLREGDVLRKEYPDSTQLLQAAKLITGKVDYNDIIFYHWHQPAIQRYEKTIQHIFSSY